MNLLCASSVSPGGTIAVVVSPDTLSALTASLPWDLPSLLSYILILLAYLYISHFAVSIHSFSVFEVNILS